MAFTQQQPTNSLGEFLKDFKELNIGQEPRYSSIYSSDKSDEWKAEQIMKEYINTNADIWPEHKPVFYKVFARHPRWSTKPKDDITIYKAGEKIKSYGTVKHLQDGSKEVISISYKKCIYNEADLRNTVEALYNATYDIRKEMKSNCYQNGKCCTTCKTRNHIKNFRIVLGSRTQKELAHAFLNFIDIPVLAYEIIDGRPQLTQSANIHDWHHYFKSQATPELACEKCNTARYNKLLATRHSNFTHFVKLN